MCSNLRLSKSAKIVRPGARLLYSIFGGGKSTVQMGTWGMMGGVIYNVRSESMHQKFLDIAQNRGILKVESFSEGGKEFYGKIPLNIAVIFNGNKEFSILTMDSVPPVSNYHRRMPLIINDNEDSVMRWLTIGYIDLLPTSSSLSVRA